MSARLAAALGAALLLGGCVTAGFDARRRGDLAREVIAGWPDGPRLAAQDMIERYGPPDAIAGDGLGWRRRDPWKRITVRVAEPDAVVRETVAYRTPDARASAVAAYAAEAGVETEAGELTARAGDERRNILALNLADQVARGTREADDAARTYRRIIRLEAAGKSSVYADRLLFSPAE